MIDGQNKWDLAVRSQCNVELRQARWQARALVPLPLSHWRAPCVKVDERTCTTRTNRHEQLAACSVAVRCPSVTSKQSPPARAADESYYISSLSLALSCAPIHCLYNLRTIRPSSIDLDNRILHIQHLALPLSLGFPIHFHPIPYSALVFLSEFQTAITCPLLPI